MSEITHLWWRFSSEMILWGFMSVHMIISLLFQSFSFTDKSSFCFASCFIHLCGAVLCNWLSECELFITLLDHAFLWFAGGVLLVIRILRAFICRWHLEKPVYSSFTVHSIAYRLLCMRINNFFGFKNIHVDG